MNEIKNNYYRKKKKDKKIIEFSTCPKCGYNNQPEKIKKFGTCLRCGEVIDSKAKFEYEMVCRLRLWRDKKGSRYRRIIEQDDKKII